MARKSLSIVTDGLLKRGLNAALSITVRGLLYITATGGPTSMSIINVVGGQVIKLNETEVKMKLILNNVKIIPVE